MLNYLLLILCAIAAVHNLEMKKIDISSCRDDDSTYTFLRGYEKLLWKPNEEYRRFANYGSEDECELAEGVVSKTGFECIQRLINYCGGNYPESTPPVLPVTNATTTFAKKIRSTPFKLIQSASVYVDNDSDISQEGYSKLETIQETQANEMSVGQKIGFKASASFGIPFIGETKIAVSGEFGFGKKWTSTTSKTITFPAQKVVVPPKSKIRLDLEVHLAKFESNYLGNFILDTGDRVIGRCLYALRQFNHTLGLEKPGMVNDVTAIFNENQQTLNNVPLTYTSDGFDTRVYVSKAEPISTVINDPTIPVVNVLDLSSFNFFNSN